MKKSEVGNDHPEKRKYPIDDPNKHTIDEFSDGIDNELFLKKSHALKERNKELRALYKISELTSDMNLNLEEAIVQILEVIKQSWQFPGITQAKVRIFDKDYRSRNYTVQVAEQSSPIMVNRSNKGSISVSYTREKPVIDEGPFLKEERALLNNIATHLSKFVERKQAESQLQFKSTLVNSVSESVVTTDPNGIITYWNQAAEKIFGWKSAEVLGKNILDVTPSEATKETAELIMKGLGLGESWSGEFVVQRKNGEKFPASVSNSPIRDGKGEIVGIIGISRDISEQVNDRKALQESYDKLQNISENLPGMIFQFKRAASGEESLVYVSGASEDLFGVEPGEAIKDVSLLFKAIHPEDQDVFRRRIDESYRSLKPYKSIHRTILPDGSINWVEASSLPRQHENGDVVWTGVVLNITDYQDTKSRLQKSEERFNDISENLPGLVYQFEMLPDGSFAVPYISKSAEKIFNLPRHHLKKAENLLKKIHPDDLEDMMTSVFESAGKMIPWFKEVRVSSEQGKVKWIQGRAIPRKQKSGSILWNGVLVDITEQKIAELAVQENEEKLQEAQQIAEMGNFELGLPDKKIKWSLEMSRLLGIPYSEEVVELTTFKDLVAADDKWKIPHYVDIVVKKGINASFDLKMKGENTEVRYLNITGKPRKDESGRVVAIIGTALNITKRKTYENELKKSKEKAEESDRLKSVFLQTMSHELRTPLNAIIGFSDLILDEEIENHQYKEFVRLINNSGKHLLDIIEDLFEITALETGQSRIRYEEIKLQDLFNELSLTIEEEKKKRQKKTITTSYAPLGNRAKITINADKSKLKRLLTNLMVNALKFTHEGSVEYGYKIYRNMVLFYVKDTGIGIDTDKQKIIFERFRQEEESPTREYEGVGLGLSICKIIADLLQGDIWVESEKGKGSVFYFMLPVNTNEEPEREDSSRAAEGRVKSEGAFKGKKILIVEDEKSNMKLLELMLKHQGAGILKAFNGRQAVSIFQKEADIDLILMDIKMPEMNGFDATREIRKSNRQIPIIALTAYAQEGDRQKAIEAGCSDYVSKPLRKNILIEKLQLHLST